MAKTDIGSIVQDALLAGLLEKDVTISQLQELVQDPGAAFLGSMTLNELFGESGSKKKKWRAKRTATATGSSKLNTRTQEGRHIYDRAIFDLLVKGAKDGKDFKRFSAPEIRIEVGGSPDQVRKALNRMCGLDNAYKPALLSWEGRAQATRYFRTGKDFPEMVEEEEEEAA